MSDRSIASALAHAPALSSETSTTDGSPYVPGEERGTDAAGDGHSADVSP